MDNNAIETIKALNLALNLIKNDPSIETVMTIYCRTMAQGVLLGLRLIFLGYVKNLSTLIRMIKIDIENIKNS